MTVSGLSLTATDKTGANGLKMIYNGNSSLSGATINYTVGLGAQINFAIDGFLSTDGVIESELNNLDGQNKLATDRINEMQTRLDLERQSLLTKFQHMETTLATAQNIMNSLNSTIGSAFNSSTH